MIYEFALEPDLVATWHDRREAYPILSQIGPGMSRVACAFPSDTWKNLVIAALRALFPGESPEWQAAKKSIEVLLRHLQETGTARPGYISHGETWFAAAQREHGQYPFGGIVVKSSTLRRDYLVIADRLGVEEFAAWNRPARPVLRQPQELAAALAPLLRCAPCVRFVDPYFDATDQMFLDPMRELLAVMQQRRDRKDLQVELHFGVGPDEIDRARRAGRATNETGLAQAKVHAFRSQLLPLLQPGVTLRVRVWAPLVDRLHNRYVLTKVGGVMIGTGLDQAPPGSGHTDDLTLLSKEQLQKRWAQYARNSTDLRLLAHWDGTAP